MLKEKKTIKIQTQNQENMNGVINIELYLKLFVSGLQLQGQTTRESGTYT